MLYSSMMDFLCFRPDPDCFHGFTCAWPISEISAGHSHIKIQCITSPPQHPFPGTCNGQLIEMGFLTGNSEDPVTHDGEQHHGEKIAVLYFSSAGKVTRLFSLLINRLTFSPTAVICCEIFYIFSWKWSQVNGFLHNACPQILWLFTFILERSVKIFQNRLAI